MVEKEFDKGKRGVKPSKVSVGFGINECPLWLYKAFTSDIHKYNNTSWIKLMDVMRKAEMYDYIVIEGNSEPYPVDEEEDIDKPTDKFGVETMGGYQEYSPKVQEKIRKEKEVEENER